MIHTQRHLRKLNTFIHLLKGQENQSMKLSKKSVQYSYVKQNNEIITKWKKIFSIANYSYVNKTTKSLQNEKMTFNCK
jgi:hypothetical protein